LLRREELANKAGEKKERIRMRLSCGFFGNGGRKKKKKGGEKVSVETGGGEEDGGGWE